MVFKSLTVFCQAPLGFFFYSEYFTLYCHQICVQNDSLNKKISVQTRGHQVFFISLSNAVKKENPVTKRIRKKVKRHRFHVQVVLNKISDLGHILFLKCLVNDTFRRRTQLHSCFWFPFGALTLYLNCQKKKLLLLLSVMKHNV